MNAEVNSGNRKASNFFLPRLPWYLTQDYAKLSSFINKNRQTHKKLSKIKIYSDKPFYRSEKQKRIIFVARRLASDLKSVLKRIGLFYHSF